VIFSWITVEELIGVDVQVREAGTLPEQTKEVCLALVPSFATMPLTKPYRSDLATPVMTHPKQEPMSVPLVFGLKGTRCEKCAETFKIYLSTGAQELGTDMQIEGIAL